MIVIQQAKRNGQIQDIFWKEDQQDLLTEGLLGSGCGDGISDGRGEMKNDSRVLALANYRDGSEFY